MRGSTSPSAVPVLTSERGIAAAKLASLAQADVSRETQRQRDPGLRPAGRPRRQPPAARGAVRDARAVVRRAVPLVAGGPALVAFALLFGLVDFSVVAPTQWLAARYVEPRTVGLAFGCLNAIHQLGSAIGAWLPGVAYDATGSYDGVLVVAAGRAGHRVGDLPRSSPPIAAHPGAGTRAGAGAALEAVARPA